MSKKLLIATLGTSPAVITEAIDLLDEQGMRPDGVIPLMTQDSDVRDSYNVLAKHLPDYYGITWVDPAFISDYTDVETPEIAVEFMQTACQRLKSYREAGYRCFVGIAGGRKAMSSLLALAVQFYGADRLFHIWVPPWIEDEGEISSLRPYLDYPDKLTEKLHPSLDLPLGERPHLVDLPFIGLFPLLQDILAALKADDHSSREIRDLLRVNGLITSTGETTKLGDRVAKILEEVESLPPPCSDEQKISLNRSEPKFKQFLNEACDRLRRQFPFVCRISDIAWQAGENKVQANEPNELHVYLRPRGKDFTVGLLLTTTANSVGQLEAARRAVEQFVKLSW
jgi:CRISPR-associated protein Csx14